MTQDNKDLIKAIENLNTNFELLIKLTALSFSKESLFSKTDTKQQQIDALEPLDLPDKIIALMIGSTSDSVKALRNQGKSKKKKTEDKEPKKEGLGKVE